MAAPQTITTTSRDETESWAKNFAKTLPRGSVVALIGNLGAGKTVIAKGFGKALGIRDDVISPTFNYILEYPGTFPLYHADLYRLEDSREFQVLGFDEYFDNDGLFVIEWAERIEDSLPSETIFIRIEPGSKDSERRITISK